MKIQFEILAVYRKDALKLVENLSLDELNEIPAGFSNNIAWNLGHLLFGQQLLCYQMSGQNLSISEELFNKYGKGTRPETPMDQEEFELVKAKLVETIEVLQRDYENGRFKHFEKYTTSTGFDLSSIERAIVFNNVHEAEHLGLMKAIYKIVKK